jgi:hypothetical protein
MRRVQFILAGFALAAAAVTPLVQAKQPVNGCPEGWGLSKVITDKDEAVDEAGNGDNFICFKDTKKNVEEETKNPHDDETPGNPGQGNSDFDDETVKDNTVPND